MCVFFFSLFFFLFFLFLFSSFLSEQAVNRQIMIIQKMLVLMFSSVISVLCADGFQILPVISVLCVLTGLRS